MAEVLKSAMRFTHHTTQLELQRRDNMALQKSTKAPRLVWPSLFDLSYSVNAALPHRLTSTSSAFARPTCTAVHPSQVIVPFRNATAELVYFVPFMHTFLRRHGIDFELVIVNQADQHRFNRAQLIDVGFLHVRGTVHVASFTSHDTERDGGVRLHCDARRGSAAAERSPAIHIPDKHHAHRVARAPPHVLRC